MLASNNIQRTLSKPIQSANLDQSGMPSGAFCLFRQKKKVCEDLGIASLSTSFTRDYPLPWDPKKEWFFPAPSEKIE
jgi:hypothetical protein